mmetsp:Transcript_123811/g.361493  ORF Transcript_123811/g.361493 Transcript_123811/m.361493 type:complete len:310 (-) Transcript_123811:84-1013(-)
MVCAFGLGPEAATWIASKGAAAWGGFWTYGDSHLAALSASAPLGKLGVHGARGVAATAFNDAEHDDKEGDHGEHEEKGEEEHGGHEGGIGKLFEHGCFPASASLYVKGRGPVRVSEVRPGDLLLCGDAARGLLLFSPFLGHLHREVAARADYVTLEVAGGGATLAVSSEHLVFASSSPSAPPAATRADELREGHWLSRVSCDGDLSRVRINAVAKACKKGVYCPLTECGTVVVDGALCSCYTDAFLTTAPSWLHRLAATHQVAHGVLLPLRLACRLGWGPAPRSAPREGIHPFCRALMALPVGATQAVA